MPTAIVAGALANKPRNGGEAWVRLSWALGLQRLGFEVWFAEQIAGSPNRAWFESVVREFGLDGRAALLCEDGAEGAGVSAAEFEEVVARADVLFNVSGNLDVERLPAAPRRSVYVDLDPGFTQAWHADPAVPFRIPRHDRYITVGLNVGAPGCPIPAGGLEWIPTLPPVVLEQWPMRPPSPGPLRLTTVATWRSPFGPLEIGGRAMGLKHHQFRRFLALPERVEGVSFELALDIHPGDAGDREALLQHGWTLTEPRRVAATPVAFRDYVAASGGEFSVAQGVYVEAASGWFSDRTAAYLACGRPALVQDTGLGGRLPLGRGLLAFGSLEEAVARAEAIRDDREGHGAAARAFAEEHLDSDRVLGRLLDAVGVAG